MKELLKSLKIEGEAAEKILALTEKQSNDNALALSKLQKELTDAAMQDKSRAAAEIESLRSTVNRYEREAAEREAFKKVSERFDRVSRGQSFVNDITRRGILEKFRAELENAENASLSDDEVYSRVIDSESGIFASGSDVPSVVATTKSPADSALSDADVREIMGL